MTARFPAMGRVALISDIHANLHALEAVLEQIDALAVERIYCLGDTVGYGPHPAECVRMLRQRGIEGVLGNHDAYAIKLRDETFGQAESEGLWRHPVWGPLMLAREKLSDEDWAWLEGQPMRRARESAIFTHAAMHDEEEWPYLDEEAPVIETLKVLATTPEKTGFFGHTHLFRIFTDAGAGNVPVPDGPSRWILPRGCACAVTAGSVGQPRDRARLASFITWNAETRAVECHRVPYPQRLAMEAILDAGLHFNNGMRLLPPEHEEDDIEELRPDGPEYQGSFTG